VKDIYCLSDLFSLKEVIRINNTINIENSFRIILKALTDFNILVIIQVQYCF